MFDDLNNPKPSEIKRWLRDTELTVSRGAVALGISNRQLLRFLSGETNAKRVHALAMQMIWLLVEENKEKSKINDVNQNIKSIQIPIK